MSDRQKTEQRRRSRQQDQDRARNREDYVAPPYPRANDRFTYNGWMAPGPCTGYGPEDYDQESQDLRIKEELSDRLMRNGQLDALGISVVVSSGKVSLDGVVSSERDRRIAENVARSVPGVRRVFDHLRIAGDLHSTPPYE